MRTQTGGTKSNNLPSQSSYIIHKLLPASFCLKFVVLLSELLNAFEMHLLLRVQTLVLFWIRVLLLADQMLKEHKSKCVKATTEYTAR